MSESTPPPPPPGADVPGAPPPGPPTTAPSAPAVTLRGSAWFSVAAVALLAVAVSVPEDGDNGWGRFGVWAGFAIAAALATLAPSLRQQFKMSSETAWRVASAGGIGLVAYWVLFVLPWIEQNVGFVATVGCAAGAYAAWVAPGRPHSARAQPF